MRRTEQLEAIVLRTYNVGEADRFCILLTKERGRIAARATGTRKPKSRMGGALLPFRQVNMSLKEESSGCYISAASVIEALLGDAPSVKSFAYAEQGTELLLSLVQHEEPLPEVFDATASFLRSLRERESEALLAYTLRLLHVLGLLQEEGDLLLLGNLTAEQLLFLREALRGEMPRKTGSLSQLRLLCARLLEQQLSSPLRTPNITALLE